MARIMNSLPVIILSVKNGENLEDGDDFLMITLDMVLEVEQSVFYRVTDGLLELPI